MEFLITIVVALVVYGGTRFLPREGRRRVVPFDTSFDPELHRRIGVARTGKGETALDRAISNLHYPDLEQLWREEDAASLEAFRVRRAKRAEDVLARDQESTEGSTATLVAPNPLVVSVAAEPEGEYKDRGIFFRKNEPQTFEGYIGQKHITTLLKTHVKALEPTERVIDHFCLTGVPGQGKTLLAKVLTAELDARAQQLGLGHVPFFETFAIDLDSIGEFDKAVRKIIKAGGGVWLIDETHLLDEDFATKLYTLMTDGRYSFHGELSTVPVPAVTVIGATTDYGMMHAALKRRFGEPFRLRPASESELLHVVTHQNDKVGIDEEAARLIVSRTKFSGAPWEAIEIFGHAAVFAKAEQRGTITLDDVDAVFQTFEIDDQGLRWMDRAVLKALFTRPRRRGKDQEFVCFAASERDICGMTGLDEEDYRTGIKGRLMSRGLLEVRTGYGQALTPRAIDLYQETLAVEV